MKASVNPDKVKCPVCGEHAKQMKGNDYKCIKGDEFSA